MDLYNLENLENKELMAKAYRLQNDTNKFPLWLHARCNFLSNWLKIPAQKYYGDVRVMLDAQLEFRRRFKGINTLAPDYGVSLLPSAFGIKIKWPDGFMIPAVKKLSDLTAYVEQLAVPDPRVDGYLPAFYNAFFYYQSQVGDLLGPTHPVLSPFEIAASLIGINNTFFAVKQYPKALHKLLQKTTQFMIRVYENDAELFGLKSFPEVYLGEDLPGLLSKEDFMEFVFPYTKKVYDYFKDENTLNIWHCDSKMGHLIEAIPQMGVNVLYNFDPDTDLAQYVDKIGDKVALVGNIHPIKVLYYGTKEEVQRETLRQLELAKNIKGFVAAPGGELPSGVSDEKIDAFIDTVTSFRKG